MPSSPRCQVSIERTTSLNAMKRHDGRKRRVNMPERERTKSNKVRAIEVLQSTQTGTAGIARRRDHTCATQTRSSCMQARAGGGSWVLNGITMQASSGGDSHGFESNVQCTRAPRRRRSRRARVSLSRLLQRSDAITDVCPRCRTDKRKRCGTRTKNESLASFYNEDLSRLAIRYYTRYRLSLLYHTHRNCA